MDPLSITTSATAFLGICMQTIQLIQRTIETVKNSRSLLVKLLSQTERLRLNLEQLRSLTAQLGTRAGMLLSYNDSAPRQTMKELNELVRKIAENPSYLGIQTLLNKSKVDALVERLKKHEEEIVTVLLSIATASAVRTEEEVLRMHKEFRTQSEVLNLFSDLSLTDNSSTNKISDDATPSITSPKTAKAFNTSKSLQIWFGDTHREGFDAEYLSLRDRLSDAAHFGNFRTVFQVLEIAEEKYNESWINSPRLGHDPSTASGWTPLHQFVYMGASKKTVESLLDLGALRTIRSAKTQPHEFRYLDMTAGEIARELGSSYLYQILAPVVVNHVPYSTLEKLQEYLHQIIREDGFWIAAPQYLRLPDLSLLTELEIPEMLFPLKNASHEASRGYLYRLDGRELLVKAFGIRDAADSRLFRISSHGIRKIVDIVAFNNSLTPS